MGDRQTESDRVRVGETETVTGVERVTDCGEWEGGTDRQ